jgi:hypothetical protein
MKKIEEEIILNDQKFEGIDSTELSDVTNVSL